MNLNKNRVAVAMSGGVDSSVTAYLLQKEGYEVIGLTMLLFNHYDKYGNIIEPEFIQDARRICDRLGIPHYVLDFRNDFEKAVKKEFIEEYLKGKTPNPCVICNKKIKYGKLLEAAQRFGAYYMATGHYATISYDENIHRYRIFRGKADRKDQSYVLHSLSQEQLQHVILPLGRFSSKQEVRKLAVQIDLNIAKKSDSTGICFIPNQDYAGFIKQHTEDKVIPGDFVDMNGNVLGKHKGIVHYTIGQKRNLGIQFHPPRFVVKIDAKKNQIVLGNDEDTYAAGFTAKNVNFTWFDQLDSELRVNVKVCQWGWFLSAVITKIDDETIKVIFDKKERAVAPGQAVVFYNENEEEVIGGGIIDSVIKEIY